MGKKSAGENSLMESAFENKIVPSEVGDVSVHGEENLQAMLVQMLKRVKHAKENMLDMLVINIIIIEYCYEYYDYISLCFLFL